MKFIWLDKEKYPDQIPFLKGNYDSFQSADPDISVYKIKKETDQIRSRMKTLESCGFLKIMKAERMNELETYIDIIPMTQRVEKIKSSPMYLKIFFPNASFLLSETELLSVVAFRKCLLREGKFIPIPTKAWGVIVQHWLDVSEEIIEETEDDYIVDKILNYLANCVVYEDIDKAISRNTLHYDKEDNGVVYSRVDTVVEFVNNKRKTEISSRKLRAALSGYIVGDSLRKRIFNNRYRFWKFDIKSTGVNIEKQLYVKDEGDHPLVTNTDKQGTLSDLDGGDSEENNQNIR
jgi:hypothetical protein